MTTRHGPTGVEPDDRLLHDLVLGHWKLPALAAAYRVGLLTRLADGPLTTAEVAVACGTEPLATGSVLELLASLHLLERWGGRYELTAVTRRYLLPDAPDDWGPMLRLVWDDRCAAVRDALLEDAPRGYGRRSLWRVHQEVPRQAEIFTQAMHAHSAAAATAFAERAASLGVPARAHVLDVAGGRGTYAIALARRHPELTATVLELGSVCPIASRAVGDAGLDGRITVVEGDMFTTPWPSADVVLLADVMHNWSVGRCRELADRSRKALRPGGRLLVHDMLLDDAVPGPATAAANAVAMAATTGGHQFTATELAGLLRQAGFGSVSSTPSFGYFSVTTARAAGFEGAP
ncbi:methyltransferase [Streptomyces naphthomycinicus]|uniref:methyltransferase n=1 Tax=Streptomyces naphthomycinicus TaxID=2872625 RepID=UPI001CED132E|nr:methyltransferase [Streptomyces sp. TML10]